jgi:hypothetical protein
MVTHFARQHSPKCAALRQALDGDARMHANLGNGDCNCDGYHTFEELYDHRITLFIALCKMIVGRGREGGGYGSGDKYTVWRAKLHRDGSKFDGWFIMGVGMKAGEQITYHLPIARWEDTNFAETLEYAPPWDGHTSDDVLVRLKAL